MKPTRYTTVVIVALVALRLGCGWLFFREGSKKLDGGNFSSEAFLRDAKGPFAGMYFGLIPDPYGDYRQDERYTEGEWKYYYNDAAKHYDFDDEQLKQAENAYKRALAKLKYFLNETQEEREKNFLESRRLYAAAEDPTSSVNFRRSWMEKQDKEINTELQGWLKEIDAIWEDYERDIADIARGGMYEMGDGSTRSQYDLYGPYPLRKPGASGINSGFADSFIPWLTFGVGVLLVLGLFTRVAAIAGGAFLISVIATQPPFVPSASDVNYQIVLLMGLLVVAAVGAGRWGGLDFFIRWGYSKCCGSSSQAESNTTTNAAAPNSAAKQPQASNKS